MRSRIWMILAVAWLAVAGGAALGAQDAPKNPAPTPAAAAPAAPAPGAPLNLPPWPSDPAAGPGGNPAAQSGGARMPAPAPLASPRTAGPRGILSPGMPAAGFSGGPAAPSAASAPSVMGEDIRDIRGPIHIPEGLDWTWIAGGAAALAVLAAAAYAIHRLRRRALTRARLAHEVAFEALEKARALLEAGKARAFAYAVSDAVRHYLEQRFRLAAGRRTTEEFMTELTDPECVPAVLAGHRDGLGDFLSHCDFGKFARGALTVDRMESMLASARRFVSATRYREEESPGKSRGRAGRKRNDRKNRNQDQDNDRDRDRSSDAASQDDARTHDEPVMGGVS